MKFILLIFSVYSTSVLAMGNRYQHSDAELAVHASLPKPQFVSEGLNEQQAQQESLNACHAKLQTLPFNQIEFSHQERLKDLGCQKRKLEKVDDYYTLCHYQAASADFKITGCRMECKSHSFAHGFSRTRCTATYAYAQTSPVKMSVEYFYPPPSQPSPFN